MKNTYFELTGVVRHATETKAYLGVEGIDYKVPVEIKNANKYVGKTISVKGHLLVKVDTLILIADEVK